MQALLVLALLQSALGTALGSVVHVRYARKAGEPGDAFYESYYHVTARCNFLANAVHTACHVHALRIRLPQACSIVPLCSCSSTSL